MIHILNWVFEHAKWHILSAIRKNNLPEQIYQKIFCQSKYIKTPSERILTDIFFFCRFTCENDLFWRISEFISKINLPEQIYKNASERTLTYKKNIWLQKCVCGTLTDKKKIWVTKMWFGHEQKTFGCKSVFWAWSERTLTDKKKNWCKSVFWGKNFFWSKNSFLVMSGGGSKKGRGTEYLFRDNSLERRAIFFKLCHIISNQFFFWFFARKMQFFTFVIFWCIPPFWTRSWKREIQNSIRCDARIFHIDWT